MTRPPGHHAWRAFSLRGLLVRIERRDERVDHGLDQAPADAGDERAVPQHVARRRAGREVAGKDHHAASRRQADAGERQKQAHADVVEQRAAERDRERETEKRHAEHAGDHARRSAPCRSDRRTRAADRSPVSARSAVATPAVVEREAADEEQPGLLVRRVTIRNSGRGTPNYGRRSHPENLRGVVHSMLFPELHAGHPRATSASAPSPPNGRPRARRIDIDRRSL